MFNHPKSVCYFTVGNAFIGIVSDSDIHLYILSIYTIFKKSGALSYTSCPP